MAWNAPSPEQRPSGGPSEPSPLCESEWRHGTAAPTNHHAAGVRSRLRPLAERRGWAPRCLVDSARWGDAEAPCGREASGSHRVASARAKGRPVARENNSVMFPCDVGMRRWQGCRRFETLVCWQTHARARHGSHTLSSGSPIELLADLAARGTRPCLENRMGFGLSPGNRIDSVEHACHRI